MGNFSDSLVGEKGRFVFGLICCWKMAGNRRWRRHPHWKKWSGSPRRRGHWGELHTKKWLCPEKKKKTKNCAISQGDRLTLRLCHHGLLTKTRPADVSQQHQMPFQNRDSFHVFGHRREVLPSMWVELGTVWNSC